ncbi:MAG: hypothetical protein HQ581_14920 [Planctomycetes bacterium]|nr:hypothetical protein [Planctomycetota bacterium]
MPGRMARILQTGMDENAAILQRGMDQNAAIVAKAMAELVASVVPWGKIGQRFLDAGEIRIECDVTGMKADPDKPGKLPWPVELLDSLIGDAAIVIPIPPKKTEAAK